MQRITSYLFASLSLLLLAQPSTAEPVHQHLIPLTTAVVSSEQVVQQTTAIDAALEQIQPPAILPAFARSQAGRASLTPLFSAQSGSWPFESFVHAGLFKVIAGYQTSHPRMIYITGDLTLAQVHQQVQQPNALRPHKDGFLLSYPLMIAPGATLRIENTELYLFAHSGAAVINQGRLQINHAKVESYSGEEHAQNRAYRPFIMAWAGSQTRIVNSQLSRLGYNAHLAHGFSTARSSQQAAHVPAAKVFISHSQLEGLSSIYLQDAEATIEDSQIRQMQLYGIDASNSRLFVRNNHIEQVRNHHGIRLSGASNALLQGNHVKQTAKAALALNNFTGRLLAESNELGQTATYAIQVRAMPNTGLAVFRQNLLSNVPLNLIDAESDGTLLISQNRLEQSSHAINLSGNGKSLILDNRFTQITESALKSEGPSHILLGANQFDGKVILQRLFQGNLLPIQSIIVDSTIKQSCYLQIGATSNPTGQTAPHCNGTLALNQP